MKSYQALFTKTENNIALCGAQKPVSLLRKEYENEVLSAVYPEPLLEAMAKLSLEEQISAICCLDAFECGVLPISQLEEDFPLLSPELVKSRWSAYNSLNHEVVDSVLFTEGGLLLGLYIQGKILWLGGEISYKAIEWTSGDNNGAGYKGEGYYEATKYLTMLYRPTLLFSDIVLASSFSPEEKRVALPEGVKRIESGAFRGREVLEEILFPESLEKIGYQAFKGCTGLKRISLPASVKTVDAGAFEACTSLEYVEIKGEAEIGSMAFRGCKALKKVVLPKADIALDGWSFAECDSLLEIENAESIKALGEYTFCGCRSLVTVALSASVKYLLTSVFSGCAALKRIELPAVNSVGTYAFSHCTALEEVTMPKSAWNIGSDAFLDCISLKRVTLPRSLKESFEENAKGIDPEAITYTLLEEE